MKVSITGFNEKALKGVVNDALQKRARDLETELNRSTVLKGSHNRASAASEVQRIAKRNGLDLSRESAESIADQLHSGGSVTVSVDGLL